MTNLFGVCPFNKYYIYYKKIKQKKILFEAPESYTLPYMLPEMCLWYIFSFVMDSLYVMPNKSYSSHSYGKPGCDIITFVLGLLSEFLRIKCTPSRVKGMLMKRERYL